MKKNNKTYLLLTVVLCIWGVLGFQIIGALNPEEEAVPLTPMETDVVVQKLKKRDSILIAANYRDPFLGTPHKSELPKKKKIIVAKKPQLPKKAIQYSGSVAQNGSNNRMYFVTIDGQQHIMSKNEKIAGVTLVSGSSAAIKVNYPGHSETISLQQ